MSSTKPKRVKGCCGMCGNWQTNGKGNWALAKRMMKLGQKRRFTKTQDGW